ncbi:hypothetical protein GWI33_005176 [Rhynchophorus ferrugineus]|uniref:Uncharacterized protein n=1 Tax=Rhynchophorus ferrugineus TaxID=354439 RepID=A0A834IM43_RHYFE|nr:hypothetical protein GWI33_005176 [Rhynchophorus ferrugineus]
MSWNEETCFKLIEEYENFISNKHDQITTYQVTHDSERDDKNTLDQIDSTPRKLETIDHNRPDSTGISETIQYLGTSISTAVQQDIYSTFSTYVQKLMVSPGMFVMENKFSKPFE